MKQVIFIACVWLLAIGASAQGKLLGRVSDEQGEPLYGVVVRVVNAQGIITSTDFDGFFSLSFPDDQKYIFSLYLTGLTEVRDSLALRDGETVNRDYTLGEKGITSEEVVIEAKALRSADAYMEKIKMNSSVSIDYISSETIKKTGDNNVVNAVARVSGVSTNNGLITVRGLGDRYVKTTLNGARIPTLDPFTNNIRLDIFPASLVDNIVVSKTITPEYPGDWSGAFISVETKDYPDKLSIGIETQIGYNPQSTFQDFITSERSSTDWLGFDNGLRARKFTQIEAPVLTPTTYQEMSALGLGDYFNQLGVQNWQDGTAQADTYFRLGLVQLGLLPAGLINDATAYNAARQAYLNEYKQRAFNIINPNGKDYTNGFANNWDTRFIKAPLNFTQNFSIGDQQKVFGRDLGYFVGFRYGSTYRYDPNGISQRVGDETLGFPFDRQDIALLGRETNTISGLVNLAYKLNEHNRVSVLFMPNIIGINDVASYNNIRLPFDIQEVDAENNIFYEHRRQLIYQLSTQHFLPRKGIRLDFNASYTDGASVAPDFKALQYLYVIDGDSIVSYQFSPVAGDGIRRYYRFLDENLMDARVNVEVPIKSASGRLAGKARFGLSSMNNYRKIDNYEYRVMLGNNINLRPLLNGDIDAYMSPEKFTMRDGIIDFTYLNIDFPQNHSFGHNDVYASYGLVQLDYKDNWKFSGGVRLEYTDLFTDVDDYFRKGYGRNDPRRENVGGYPLVNAAEIKRWDMLPSIGVIYKKENSKGSRTNVRLNYGRNIARPSIRELSDATVFDNEFRLLVYGNSDLKPVEVDNYDLRLEKYAKNGDNVSFSMFYKHFRNHIEMGFGANGITWENVPISTVMGIELEGKKDITRQLEVRANVTFVRSEAEFVRRDLQVVNGIKDYIIIDTLQRPMFGQAPYLVNGILSYTSDSLGLTATVSYNIQGPRLVIAGAVRGRPDVYELPRNMVDIKITKKIGKHYLLGFQVRDLFNTAVRRSYDLPSGWVDFDSFRYGATYQLSFAYKY
jgi:outer membrane receptor protein involved in Fe transport